MPPGSKTTMVMPDRIRVGARFTKRPVEYESVSAEVSIESSVKKGENTQQAVKRVSELVRKEMDELLEEYEEQYGD